MCVGGGGIALIGHYQHKNFSPPTNDCLPRFMRKIFLKITFSDGNNTTDTNKSLGTTDEYPLCYQLNEQLKFLFFKDSERKEDY